jgi:hypothetical protein
LRIAKILPFFCILLQTLQTGPKQKSSQLKWKCLFECLFVSMQIFVASAFILLIGDCLNYANSVAAKFLASGDRLFAVWFEMKMSWNLHNLIWFFFDWNIRGNDFFYELLMFSAWNVNVKSYVYEIWVELKCDVKWASRAQRGWYQVLNIFMI